jgi:hypothetical protein
MTFSPKRMNSTARLLVLTGFAAAAACAADPVLGTWKLDVPHSRFSSEPTPLSELRIYTDSGDGIQVTVTTVDSKGKTSTTEYPTTFDGKDHVRPGAPTGTSVLLSRDSAYRASAVLTHAGAVMADVERLISTDGMTMTITYKGKNESGDPIDKSMLYLRVTGGLSR